MLRVAVCRLCASLELAVFDAEMNIHIPWLRSRELDQPSVFAFPKLVVCLDCGFSESIFSDSELQALRKGTPDVAGVPS
jgi:hypothetical protein